VSIHISLIILYLIIRECKFKSLITFFLTVGTLIAILLKETETFSVRIFTLDFANKRFLVANDTERILVIFRDFLTREGAIVETVSDSIQAVNSVTQRKFDFLILDIEFNGNNGFGLLDKLRRLDPDLPAIIITGRPNNFVLQRIQKYPKIDFLEKPVDLRSLRQKLIKTF